jgi:hypothetical protein
MKLIGSCLDRSHSNTSRFAHFIHPENTKNLIFPLFLLELQIKAELCYYMCHSNPEGRGVELISRGGYVTILRPCRKYKVIDTIANRVLCVYNCFCSSSLFASKDNVSYTFRFFPSLHEKGCLAAASKTFWASGRRKAVHALTQKSVG